MQLIDEKCNMCKLCVNACQSGLISVKDDRIEISDYCLNTPNCPAAQICPQDAIVWEERTLEEGMLKCELCPVGCEIRPGRIGECGMYVNKGGALVRTIPLTPYEEVKEIVGEECDPVIRRPLLTGIGAGIGMWRVPYIVQDKVDDVDVVSCVSESHFLYSGIMVKIDAEKYIGEEGAEVFYEGAQVGMVTPEQYGSPIVYLGGVHTLSGKNGWLAAKVTCEVANRERVELRVKGGSKLELQVGEKPVINGELCDRRLFSCGVDVAFIWARRRESLVDEGIVIHRHLGGQWGTLVPGPTKGVFRMVSGIRLRGENEIGWCLPYEGGFGWGMTNLEKPFDIVESFDPGKLNPGFTLLIMEANADRCALFEFTSEGVFKQIETPPQVMEVIEQIRENCQPARVSAYYMAGAGGGAREGVTKQPLRLSEAFRDGKASLTVAGAPALVLVGGGINIMVDVERVKPGSFHWTNAPATVAPIEWTMKLEDFISIGGNVKRIKPLKEVLEKP